MKVPDLFVGKRLFVGIGNPECLGRGPLEIRGSSYIEGPLLVGNSGAFPIVEATVMIGQETNSDSVVNPLRSVYVRGDSRFDGDGQTDHAVYVTGPTTDVVYIEGDVFITGKVDCGNKGRLAARFAVADALGKTFDIKHPSKDGWRMRYACIEGPEIGVYYRGRLKNKTEIDLPYYWKNLIHTESISVQIQPIGSHQDIIVKRWDEDKIYLQSKGGMPIDCFYHVYAERKDINPLHVEYEGETWEDYPDPNYTGKTERKPGEGLKDPRYAGPVNTVTI